VTGVQTCALPIFGGMQCISFALLVRRAGKAFQNKPIVKNRKRR
jgi:hypothetical protein